MINQIKAIRLRSVGLFFLTASFILMGNMLYSQFIPDPLYPHNNEVTKEPNIVFKWNKDVYQNLNYQFQLSTSSTFFTTITDQVTSNNVLLVSGLTNFGQMHYWRVRSQQGPISSDWSAVDSFYLFSPNSISGLSVWLDPNTGVSLSGLNVQSLGDNTLNLNNALQTSSSQRPLFVPSDSLINFKSIMRFDGVDDFLEIADNASIDFTDAFTIFTLVKPTIIAVNKTIMAKWDYQTQGSWAWQTEFATANQLMFAPCFNITDPGNQKVITTNANMQLLKPSFLSLVYNGTLTNKVKFFKNNGLLNSSTVNSIPSVLPNSTATLKIGKYGGIATRYYQGDIGEILIYNTELSPSNRTLVDKYLRYKYAPPVSLGPDTLSNPATLCTNITLKAQSVYQSYLWSNGATTSSINVNAPGEYWVTVTDFLGNISSDTIQVFSIVIPQPANTNICANQSIVWNANMGAGFTYLWSNGATSPSISISTAGNYWVKVTDGVGCTRTSDTLSFIIDMYEFTASLGNDTTLCSGNYIELVTNASETISYEWLGNTSIGQPSSYQIITTGDYWLETTNINGCVALDTIHAIVSGTAPTVTFSGQNRCFEVANTFIDGSAGVAGDPVTAWSWDFGDGVGVSSNQNPSYIYPAPGIYTVELYAISQGGCGAYHTAQVEVYTLPTASYTHTGSCSDQVIQFTNQSVPASVIINQYAWNFGQPNLGAMNVSSVQNPYRSFPTGGTFPMTLTITDAHLCVDDTVMQITVNPTPIIDVFAADACTGAAVQFTNNTVVQAPASYLWNFGDNTTSILPLPVKQYPTEGLKTITVKVTAANGCFTTDTIQMTVHPVPVASFDLGPHCKGAYTEVQSTSTISTGSIADVFWVVNLSDTLYGDTTGYEIMNLIQQQVQLFVTSDFGCTDDYNMFFDPEGAIGASFTTPSTIVACGDTVPFINTSLGATAYSWSFGNDSVSTSSNPSTVYDCSYQDSSVMVMLIASNSLGCIDTTYTFLWVGEYAIDLQVDNIYFQANGSNAILGAELKNKGTTPITSIDLNVYSEAGFVMNEVWTGNLVPNQTEIYVFTNQPAMTLSQEDETLSFYCVHGTGYANTQVEPDLTNNEVCKNIESSEVILKPLYPNPTGYTITMSLIVPESAAIEADLVDDQGRVVKQLIYPFTLASGEYTYEFDLTSIANGTYVLRFTVDGKTELHRLVVLK